VRSDESTINAFYNVCRHRGSLICTKPQGHLARLTCGYHAWSYGLDGALLAARLMPADFSKKDNGLHRCHIRVFHGFIFINLSDEPPVDFDAAFADLAPTWIFMDSPMRKSRMRSPTPPRRIGN
jgi:phenylpropionate dioxygenase-like ring-hydroxylating dioxygenase large terminal subunit